MLTVAGVVAVDTEPEQLRISDRVPPLDAVAVHRVQAGGGLSVELRILAASHQVVVVRPGEVEHVETVACGLPGAAAGEPLHDGGTYQYGRWQMTTSVVRHDAEGFRHEATRWRRRGRFDPGSLVVQFPNHPDALTGLAWLGEGWIGVHLYPSDGLEGGGVVVRTATVGCRDRVGSEPDTGP